MAEKGKQHLNGKALGDHPLQKSAVEAIKREAVRLLWFLLYFISKFEFENLGFERERERVWQTQRHHLCGLFTIFFVSYLEWFLSRALQGRNKLVEREDFGLFWCFSRCAARPNGPWNHKTASRNVHDTETKWEIKYDVWLTCSFIDVFFCFCFLYLIVPSTTGGRDRWTHPVPSSSSGPAAGSWRIPPWSCKFVWFSWIKIN